MIFNRRYQRILRIALPAQVGTLTYNGQAQSPVWQDFDRTKMTMGGTTSSTNAGTFTATFTPKSGYCWEDGSREAKNVIWSIGKAAGSLSFSATSVAINISALTKTITVTRAGDGAITATSSNTSVAAVSVSGTQGLVDGALDVVVGHVGRLGLGDDGGQAGVVGRVAAAAGLDRHDHLTGDLGKNLGALGVSRPLGLLYVVPLGMSGHEYLPLLV